MNVTPAADAISLYCEANHIPYDVDDQCMKVYIAAYAVLGQKGDQGGGPRIEFQLRPLTRPVIFKNKLEQTVPPPADVDAEGHVVRLAVISLIKHLDKAGCVGKDLLTFQYRRGDKLSPTNLPSEIVAIPLKPGLKDTFSFPEILNYLASGIISRTYAYLNRQQACFYLNDDRPATITKITDVLKTLFPAQN